MAETFLLDIDITFLYESSREDIVLLREADVVMYRYHEGSGTMVLATEGQEDETIRLFRYVIPEQRVTLLWSQKLEDWNSRWRWMEMSHDGRTVAVARGGSDYGKAGGVHYMIWEEEELRYTEVDDLIDRRFSDHESIDMFYAALHPDGIHAFHWMYASEMLKIVHVPTGKVIKQKRIPDVDAIGVSENGDRLLIAPFGGEVLSYSIPELEVEFGLAHEIGYYWWGATGVARNRSGTVLMTFEGKYRSSYVDINFEVTDHDSHLVMWKRDAKGRWKVEDAFHFQGDLKDLCADDPVALKAVGENIYFAGAINSNQLFWMELPSRRYEVHDVKWLDGRQLAFNEDGSLLYWGNSVLEMTGIRMPVVVPAEPMAVVPLGKIVKEPEPVFVPEDWRQRWDATTRCLDLTGSSIRSLEFLAELPDVVSLVLDDCDVLELPDLSGFTQLRRMSLNQSLVQDFSGLSGLVDLEELSVRDCTIGDGEWLRNMVGLRRLDLGKSTVVELAPLAGMQSLESLRIDETYVNDLAPLRGLPLKELVLTKSAVDDLEPIAGNSSLEILVADLIPLLEFAPSPTWKNLRRLSISHAIVSPEALASLTSLESLELKRTDLLDFSFLRELPLLRRLNLEHTAFDDMGLLEPLSQLESLNIRNSPVFHGLEVLGKLPLKELQLDGVKFGDLGSLGLVKGLRQLYVQADRISELSKCLKSMTELESLTIAGLGKASGEVDLSFLKSMKRLKYLALHLDAIKDISPVAELTELEYLHISTSLIRSWAPLAPLKRLKTLLWSYNSTSAVDGNILMGLESLEHFKTSMHAFTHGDFLPTMTGLKHLDLDGYRGFRLRFLEFMPRLQSLTLTNAMACDSLVDLRHVPDLRQFKFWNSADAAPVFKMKRLRTLSLSQSQFEAEQLKHLIALREIEVDGSICRSLSKVPRLQSLRKLNLSGFTGEGIAGVKKLSTLRELKIKACTLDQFPDLSEMQLLETLQVNHVVVSKPATIPALRSLRNLQLESSRFPNYEWLGGLTELRELWLSNGRKAGDEPKGPGIEALFSLRKIQKLWLCTPLVTEVPSWEFLLNCHDARIELPEGAKLSRFAANLPRLRELTVEIPGRSDFGFISFFPGLHELTIVGSKFSDMDLVSMMHHLRELDVSRTRVARLTGLKGLMRLQELDLSNTKVEDIADLAGLKGLRSLKMEGLKLPSYGPLQGLQNLEWLDADVPQDGDLSPLVGKLHLGTLMIEGGKVKSLEPLFPLIEGRSLRFLSMIDVEVKSLPEGLVFDRYGFIQNYWTWREGRGG